MKKLWDRLSPSWRLFVIALGSAILMFVPAIIAGRGCFMLVGDFNSQQIPFYKIAHNAIREGQWGWNWYTDLGANFVTSYAFYLLGSPFFWLTVPFPTEALPYLMGPLLILKVTLCAMTAFWFLRRYTKQEEFAMIGALLYAFCGYSIYNIFFNHFHDVMVFFPLLLLAIDEQMEYGTKGAVAIAVAINALVNYFFFFGEVIFVVLYYFIRLAYKAYPRKWRKFFGLAVEAVLGLGISAPLVWPSVLAILQNVRLNNPLSGQNLWVFSRGRALNILVNYFLPPEFTSKQIYIDGAATRWSSLTAFIPIFGVMGVYAYAHTRRDDWLKTLIIVLVVMSFVPILNAAYYAFNASFYARWFYMLVLMMILATVRVFEEGNYRELRRASIWTLVSTVAVIAIIGLTPNFSDKEFKNLGIFNREYLAFFILLAIIALACWLVQRVLVSERRYSAKGFWKRAIAAVCIFGILFGNMYIFWGKSYAYSNKYMIDDAIKGAQNVTLPSTDDGFYRIDTDDSLSNLGMFWDLPCIHAFHSIVPASIVEFYTTCGVERSVNSKPEESQYALRSLLSVRYYCDRINCSDKFGDINDTEAETLMPYYTYYDTMNGYEVWENDCFLPMGFVYDRYITELDLEDISESRRANAMLAGIVLSDEAIRRNLDLLSHAGELSFDRLGRDDYAEDCYRLSQETVDSFTVTRTGFEAQSSFGQERLVFFSVPWEEGWSATVNGEPAVIEKANVGFMAIRVPAGKTDIVFTYSTPGLKTGLLAAAGSLCVLFVYVFLCCMVEDTRRQRAAERALETGEEAAEPENLAKHYLFPHLNRFLLKHKEFVMYAVFGIVTTAANMIVFFVCKNALGMSTVIANAIAWIVAVVVAFVGNKLFVFDSPSWAWKDVAKEAAEFVGARLFSLIVEEIFLYITIDKLGLWNVPMKLISNLIVIIINYIFSKLVIFRKPKAPAEEPVPAETVPEEYLTNRDEYGEENFDNLEDGADE